MTPMQTRSSTSACSTLRVSGVVQVCSTVGLPLGDGRIAASPRGHSAVHVANRVQCYAPFIQISPNGCRGQVVVRMRGWGYLGVMCPKINVYLPDDLAHEVKASGIPVSAVCQQALADAVAQSMTGYAGALDAKAGDLSRNFTKRAYGVLADAEKSAERAGEEPTTVALM